MASVMRLLLLFLSLTILVAAVPNPSQNHKSAQYLATFDTLVENVTPDISPITDYLGLHYLGFELVGGVSATETNLVVTPPSLPNSAVSGPTSQMDYRGPLTINTNTTSHNITYFDAQSLYFAYILQGEAAAASGTECRVLFLGVYYGGGSITVTQQASFVPNTTPPSKFQQIIFDPTLFRGLQTLTLSIIVEATTPVTTALLIDSFAYKGYSPS